jgi:type IV fimbrial biogenesis protein FimT
VARLVHPRTPPSAKRFAGPTHEHGFTLTELVATVTVAAVLVAVALPQLQVFVQNNARATRLNSLVSALAYTRSQAISRRRTLTLCPSVDGLTCNADNEYQVGFVVRDDALTADAADNDGDGSTDEADEALVRVFQPGGRASFVLCGQRADSTALDAVTFGPTGRVGDEGVNARFVYCDARGSDGARAIALSGTGSPRISEKPALLICPTATCSALP